ncbi:MAG: two pore domain potassium channel family protein [Candidatus Tectomicrobia bacterium]|nr:two pore domain potassium channel family protein [Candidatus Tectomicrobia bacterium]
MKNSRIIESLLSKPVWIYTLVAVYFFFIVAFAFIYHQALPAVVGSPSLKFNTPAASYGYVSDFLLHLYFSVITQTTVGFGDILPANKAAKFFTAFQALVGYFYLAIFTAILAGHMMHRFRKNLMERLDNDYPRMN